MRVSYTNKMRISEVRLMAISSYRNRTGGPFVLEDACLV
jgi:hypothetical protein